MPGQDMTDEEIRRQVHAVKLASEATQYFTEDELEQFVLKGLRQ